MKTTFKRIAIIGNGGGGKTTLARSLAKKYYLPIYFSAIQNTLACAYTDPPKVN